MRDRGVYGPTLVGTDPYGRPRSSWGSWLLGGLVVGVGVLWAKHQSDQIKKLYVTTGLPYEGFAKNLGVRTRALSGVAREKFQGLRQRFGDPKELSGGKGVGGETT